MVTYYWDNSAAADSAIEELRALNGIAPHAALGASLAGSLAELLLRIHISWRVDAERYLGDDMSSAEHHQSDISHAADRDALVGAIMSIGRLGLTDFCTTLTKSTVHRLAPFADDLRKVLQHIAATSDHGGQHS